jgi:hypothetical protein
MIKKYKDYNKEDLKIVILENFEANFPHLKGEYKDIEYVPFDSISNVDNWLEYWKDEFDFINTDICDRMLALAQFKQIPIRQCYSEINEVSTHCFEYDNEEYRILTDKEADEEEYETVENNIKECYMDDLRDSPAKDYVDVEKWTESWCGDRGNNLAYYDSVENEEEINGIYYYLYRIN